MPRARVTFEFPVELAERLRRVRLGAGLTQAQVAVLMGRQGRGAWNVVARLESGHVTYPSLGLVLDFLRACRADVDSIADLLNNYCRRPVLPAEQAREQVREMVAGLAPAVRSAVAKYDTKTAAAFRQEGRVRLADYTATPPGRRAWLQHEPVERRLARVRAMANLQVVRHTMEQELRKVLDPFGGNLTPGERLFLFGYASAALAAHLQPDGSKRRRAWKRLEKSAVRAGLAGREELDLARTLALELFSDIVDAGMLEKLRSGPPHELATNHRLSEAAARRATRRKAEQKEMTEFGYKRVAFRLALSRAGEGLDVDPADGRARDVLAKDISAYLLDCDPESETMRKAFAELGQRGFKPELVRAVAERVFAEFERLRDKRPKRPASVRADAAEQKPGFESASGGQEGPEIDG